MTPDEIKLLAAERVENRALREMLKKHQWGDDEMCPECEAMHFDNDTGDECSHKPGCDLAALLGDKP